MRKFVVWIGTLIVFMAVCFAIHAIPSSALDVPKAPRNAPIVDEADILSSTDEADLAKILLDYETKTGNQLAVLTVRSLEGRDVAEFAYQVASSWQIGQKDYDNGALLLVAMQEHKIRIEVGRSLEPMLTDLQSKLIIDQKIAPAFKQGDYPAGIKNGVESMISVIGGERLSPPKKTNELDMFEMVLVGLQFGFIPLIYLASYLGRSKSWWLGGILGVIPGAILAFFNFLPGIITLVIGVLVGLLLDWLLSRNYSERLMSGQDPSWWSSGGGFFGSSSGGSSGGWGGFGGGSFGGGGASGSW